jgi:hypothetical protein
MLKTTIILLLSVLGVQAELSKLEALSMIESGDNDLAIGGAGEVSRYQIMPTVWRRFTSSTDYADAQVSTWVAEQYLASLESSFQKRAGREPTDFDRYVLWNAGPSYYERIGFLSERVHRHIRERAERFVNLRQVQPAAHSPGQQTILALGSLAPQ